MHFAIGCPSTRCLPPLHIMRKKAFHIIFRSSTHPCFNMRCWANRSGSTIGTSGKRCWQIDLLSSIISFLYAYSWSISDSDVGCGGNVADVKFSVATCCCLQLPTCCVATSESNFSALKYFGCMETFLLSHILIFDSTPMRRVYTEDGYF